MRRGGESGPEGSATDDMREFRAAAPLMSENNLFLFVCFSLTALSAGNLQRSRRRRRCCCWFSKLAHFVLRVAKVSPRSCCAAIDLKHALADLLFTRAATPKGAVPERSDSLPWLSETMLGPDV